MLIHEISRKLGITARAIRFYEQKGLLSPAKMKENGYRTYTEQDAWRLQTIISLREVGMTLEDIRQTLNRTDSTSDHWDFDAKASNFDQHLTENQPLVESRSQLFLSPNAAYEAALNLIVELITPAAGEKGLDVGTATGNLGGKLQQLGAAMSAIDQSKQMLKLCESKHPDMELKLGNVLAIPFMDGQFDMVVSSFALHHLTEPQRALAWVEMLRVLKPGGRICLADYMLRDAGEQHAFMDKLISSGANKLPMMHEQVELYTVHAHLVEWLSWYTTDIHSHPINDLIYIVYAQK